MGKTSAARSAGRMEARSGHSLLSRGIIWGLVGGLAGTVVMDVFGFCVLLIAGGPDTISFSLIGDAAAAFGSRMGISIPGGTPLGVLLHYLIGWLLGITFGAGISIVTIDMNDWKRGMVVGVLFVEAMSIPMLTAAAIVLQMTPAATASYFATSFVMHLVFGSILGLFMSYALRPRRAVSASVSG